jgi:hypothetical protein
MTRAADYVVAMRASSGSGRRATSNAYVTTVKNSILANTNSYIKSQLANTNSYIATTESSHNLSTYIALGIF